MLAGLTPAEKLEIARLGLLYGPYVVLKLHTVQEGETYLSLCEGTDIPAQAGLQRAH